MPDKNHGHIVVHHQLDFRGSLEQINYELNGGPLVLVSLNILYDIGLMKGREVPKIITYFKPYKLIFIERHPRMDCAEYIVIKTLLHYIYPLFRKLINLLDLFYRRCILTLCVWQLAEYNEATMPYWGDIKAIIKIRSWLKKKDV